MGWILCGYDLAREKVVSIDHFAVVCSSVLADEGAMFPAFFCLAQASLFLMLACSIASEHQSSLQSFGPQLLAARLRDAKRVANPWRKVRGLRRTIVVGMSLLSASMTLAHIFCAGFEGKPELAPLLE